MEPSNSEIGGKLELIGELLEITGDNPFKIRAFGRAADVVERSPDPVAKKDLEELRLIPGIGDAIAHKIREIVETGTCSELEELRSRVPPGLIELLSLEGVGPKTIAVLWKKMNIQGIDDLEKAAKGRRIRALKGFGEKKEQGFLTAIAHYRVSKGRMNRLDAELVVRTVTAVLEPGKFEVAGSVRRGKSTIGDIDIVTTENPASVNPRLREVSEEVIDEGDRRTSVRVMGQRVDIRFAKESEFGSMLIYLTGSKEFNIRLREIAIQQGKKVNEYGVEDRADGRLHRFPSEEKMFEYLGLSYIPPELRENHGEIELSRENRIPRLVEAGDIRGDLHVHSDWSDGVMNLERIARKGESLGYQYILCTDHSATLGIARGLDEDQVKSQGKEIERVNRIGLSCTLLHGIEVDILSNGTLGLANSVLKDLDMVIASVHSGFREDRDTMTRRVLTAMENDNVDIIGHPTGRLIGRRQAFDIDIPRIISQARETGISLECNASPWRIDLDDTDIRQSREQGVAISIGTDSHEDAEFSHMRFGILAVRRGWCAVPDILNTLSLKELTDRVS